MILGFQLISKKIELDFLFQDLYQRTRQGTNERI